MCSALIGADNPIGCPLSSGILPSFWVDPQLPCWFPVMNPPSQVGNWHALCWWEAACFLGEIGWMTHLSDEQGPNLGLGRWVLGSLKSGWGICWLELGHRKWNGNRHGVPNMLNSTGYEPRQLPSQCPLQRARLTLKSREEAKYSRCSYMLVMEMMEFGCMSGGSDGIESGCKAGDPGSIPRLGRSLSWEGNGYPLQYFCLENSVDRGAWRATVHGAAKSWTWLSH